MSDAADENLGLGSATTVGGVVTLPEDVSHEEIVGLTTFRAEFVHAVKQSWILRIGLALVAIALFLTVFGPLLAPYNLTAATSVISAPPSSAHWFGTDASGFDVFSRTIAAPRIDITIAILATLLSFVLGSLIGLLASFFRGGAGAFVVRTSDTVQAFPLFVLALIIVVMSGRSYASIILVIALLNVPIYLRLMRGQVLSLRDRTFVEAARANGDSEIAIAFRHVLPNALAPGFAQASITFGISILFTAGLSFIGAGVQPPTAEWGSMIASGRDVILIGQWWPSVFPGIAISLTVFGFATVGETLQTILLRRT